MSLLSFIFDISTGGLPREAREELEEGELEPVSARPMTFQQEAGVCNGCGRTYHPMWVHCNCPRGCGGMVF